MSPGAGGIKYYKNKHTAQKNLGNRIICNRGITSYFVMDTYADFLDEITKAFPKNYYEYIPKDVPVRLFYDIEIYSGQSEYFQNYNTILDTIHENVTRRFNDLNHKRIVLQSHSTSKLSFHVLYILRSNNSEYCFKNVSELKELYKAFQLGEFKDKNNKYIIDPSVYREGLFRTIYSSKDLENRPLVKSGLSDDFDDLETFVCNVSTDHVLIVENAQDTTPATITEHINSTTCSTTCEDLSESDKLIIKKFVQKDFYHMPGKVRDIFIDRTHNCIIVALSERYCTFVGREHISNNQYIVIDTVSAKQKCHDTECSALKHNEIKLPEFPKEINEIIKKCLRVSDQELELINTTIVQCKNYINENFDTDIQQVSFDKNEMVFKGDVSNKTLARVLQGKCPECNVEHQIGDFGYCLKCKVCKQIFPKNQTIPIDSDRYSGVTGFWSNYSQLVNYGTVNNIINIYNTQGTDLEYSCDIKLDNAIFRSKEITNILNQILDGHKITMISKLLFTIKKNFVYSKNNWYFFNGSIWTVDDDNIEMKKDIIELSNVFDRIKTYYESKSPNTDSTISLNKNIKGLINKFHRPGFQDDIIKGAKIYNYNEKFFKNLNSKKHLVPFTNGVYDLLDNKFRKTKREDYINLTVMYDYNPSVKNKDVFTFLEQILPNESVRDFVLKKMSDCLNGDIPNTYFLMFIGDSGANGKSQLLNLMKACLGEFAEKVEVTLLTRKRNNANEANTEKVKLMNKRFAFLSEPEDGERINIGLLKELTGSEEIVARGLYQDSMSFIMEAKLFLACNELPDIKGEDTALWRRIRVIDFPSRFVDNPTEPGEFKADKTIPSKIRENVSWKQTFMNILLDYYYKDIPEPEEVKVKTNEYRQDNNDFFTWLCENIVHKESEVLKLKDVVEAYTGKNVTKNKELSKYRKEIEKFIKESFKNEGVQWMHSKIRVSDEISTRGWKDLCIKN